MTYRALYTREALALSAGALTSVGVLFPALFAVSFVGFISFILLLLQRPLERNNLLITLCFGFSYCGGVHIWLWDLLPLDWLGVTQPIYGYALLLFYWSTIALSFGTAFLIFTFLFNRFKPTHPLAISVYAASLWTIAQYLQMWGTSLVTAGDGSLFGAHYSTVMVGYAVADVPGALITARYGGIFAMTFVFVFLATLVALAIKRWMREGAFNVELYTALLCITILASISFFVPQQPLQKHTIPVAIVTTNFEPQSNFTWEGVTNKVQSMLLKDVPTAPQGSLYVLPEEISMISDHDALLLSALDNGQHGVLFSNEVPVEGKKRLRMSLYHRGTSTGFYDKMLLSPQGEYGPWFYQVWLGIIGGAELVEASRSYYTYARGETTAVAHIQDATVGALFCSDILSPQLYRLLTLAGAEFLTESTSLGWFHSSPVVDSAMLTIARVRAAENNRYLVVAGNAAPSSVISNTGAVLERTQMNSFSVIHYNVPLISETTLYTQLGNLALLPALIGSTLPIILGMYKRREETI